METTKRIVFGLFLIVCLIPQARSIEKLQLTIQGSNVRLTWPGRTGETYIVQFRPTLETNDSWQTLTNLMPPAVGTNHTAFTHAGGFQCGAGSAAMMASGTDAQGAESRSTDTVAVSFAAVQESRSIRMGRRSEEIAASRQRAPYPWEIGERPPYPWEADVQRQDTKRLHSGQGGAKSASTQPVSDEPQTGQAASFDAGSSPACLGFYRVVRNGIYFFGITNGTVLSGQAVLPIEAGFPSATTLDAIYVNQGSDSASGTNVPGLEVTGLDEGLPRAVWNTALIPNGTYRLNLGGTINNATEVSGSSVNVVVSNRVWFPDSFLRAGYFLEVQAQSIHANGIYHVDVYDDTGFTIVSVDGSTDAQGYVTYDGIRGFRIENYDPNTFEIYPSLYYRIVVATAPGGGVFTAAAQTASNTNFVWSEPIWPVSTAQNLLTQFAIGYQPIFGSPASGNISAVALQSMMQVVYTAAESRAGEPGVIRGGSQNPFEMWSQPDFTRLLRDFRFDAVRNLYYFGHGNAEFIGQKSLGKYADVRDINQTLKNKGDPMKPHTLTNAHPFRFVFLDGCNTADGGLCTAFGIPKIKNMPDTDFLKKGVRFRAFMGWKGTQLIAGANHVNTDHLEFIGEFFEKWGTPLPNGNFRGIRQAILDTAAWSETSKLIIYGYEGLQFNDTLP